MHNTPFPQDTPFETPIVTFVTMISYAIDGPDNSIFRLSNDDTVVENIPYPVVSYFIWITFGVIMSVLFLNFLVSYNLHRPCIVDVIDISVHQFYTDNFSDTTKE